MFRALKSHPIFRSRLAERARTKRAQQCYVVGAHAAVFCLLSAWSWRKWPDTQLDFGHAAYDAWQLAGGKVLFRDVVYFYGPLPLHWNALLMKVFGVGLTPIFLSNLALLALDTFLVFQLLKKAAGRAAAAIASAVLLFVFGFSQFLPQGNYNYVAPYKPEIAPAITLALALLFLLCSFCERRTWLKALACGVCLGAAALCTAEVFIPAALVFAVGWWAAARPTKKDQALLVSGVSAVPLVFFFHFWRYFSAADALACTFRTFTVMFAFPSLGQFTFYRRMMGWDEPGTNLLLILGSAALVLGYLAAFAALDFGARRIFRVALQPWRLRLLGAAGALVTLVVVWAAGYSVRAWLVIPKGYPVTLALIFCWCCFEQRKRKPEAPPVALLLWSGFALALLLRIMLRPMLQHYGVFLAMPATIMFFVFLIVLLPKKLIEKGGTGQVFQGMALLLFAAFVGHSLWRSNEFYRIKTYAVGSGRDLIYAFEPAISAKGPVLREALEYLDREVPSGAAVAGFPDATILNYLSRKPKASPFSYTIGYVLPYGEDTVLKTYVEARPPYVLLVQWPRFPELPVFGQSKDYGHKALRWISENYDAIRLFGADPSLSDQFGIRVFKRKAGQ